ncbi:Homeodomain-like [Sesbania bispinosa]|nr:Homeodomain-like [Sesbania bispinosa]
MSIVVLFEERKEGQLKSCWQKLNTVVQKFSGWLQASLQCEAKWLFGTDIMAAAYEIYVKDEGKKFKLEYAWRLLKDEPKWTTEASQSS